MSISVGVWIFIGICAVVFMLPLVSYLVAKFAQMGKLAGTRSFITFRSKERK